MTTCHNDKDRIGNECLVKVSNFNSPSCTESDSSASKHASKTSCGFTGFLIVRGKKIFAVLSDKSSFNRSKRVDSPPRSSNISEEMYFICREFLKLLIAKDIVNEDFVCDIQNRPRFQLYFRAYTLDQSRVFLIESLESEKVGSNRLDIPNQFCSLQGRNKQHEQKAPGV
ncbi:hypothetical protein K501DRAFT_274616 [Backusella circina FSU 941]|nr:hypothetical protein K501DRAFT_274616 [Backusella circina FSU 941]